MWCEEGDTAMCKLAGAVAASTNVPKSVAVGALFGHISIDRPAAGECARHPAPLRGLRARNWAWDWRLAGVPLAAVLVG